MMAPVLDLVDSLCICIIFLVLVVNNAKLALEFYTRHSSIHVDLHVESEGFDQTVNIFCDLTFICSNACMQKRKPMSRKTQRRAGPPKM